MLFNTNTNKYKYFTEKNRKARKVISIDVSPHIRLHLLNIHPPIGLAAFTVFNGQIKKLFFQLFERLVKIKETTIPLKCEMKESFFWEIVLSQYCVIVNWIRGI